jgi:hypothetical protein
MGISTLVISRTSFGEARRRQYAYLTLGLRPSKEDRDPRINALKLTTVLQALNVLLPLARVSFQTSPKYLLFIYPDPSIVDDLVSLAYTLIYLANVPLPWINEIDPSGQPTDLQSLIVCKLVFPPETLCSGLSSVFLNFLSYVLNLKRFCELSRY